MTQHIPRVARLNTAEDFRSHIIKLGITLPFDEEVLAGSDSPLGASLRLNNGPIIGNRFTIHPMEG